MRTSKILILIIVGIIVFGSAGFCGYELFLKPYKPCAMTRFFCKKKEPVTPAAAPDPALAAFDAAVALQNAEKFSEAQTAWQTWLTTYPESPKKREAMAFLGKINMDLLCSSSASTNKESYTVIKGDSLDRIARKQKSNPELIQHVNGLPNINLQIGEVLLIPQLKTSVELDRQAGLLILRDHDQFLKSYTLLSFPSVGSEKNPTQTTVVDRIAMSGNKRTAFGDKKYPESEQMIVLRSCGNIVTAPAAAPSATPSTNSPTMPPGFVISATDMKELFPFIEKDTPVTVR